MSERAHPKDPRFRDRWRFHLRGGFVPWISLHRSPYRKALLWRYQWASKYCQGHDVLDIPCGMGWGTSLLRGYRTLTGMDIAPQAIVEAHQRYGAHARFIVGDMARLGFNDNVFDIVVCLEGVEHIVPPVGEAFIAETARVLRPSGELLLSSPQCRIGEHSGNPHHVKEYTLDEIRSLLEPFFDVIDVVARDVDVLRVHYLRSRRRG